jgi:hypothetical protein
VFEPCSVTFIPKFEFERLVLSVRLMLKPLVVLALVVLATVIVWL